MATAFGLCPSDSLHAHARPFSAFLSLWLWVEVLGIEERRDYHLLSSRSRRAEIEVMDSL